MAAACSQEESAPPPERWDLREIADWLLASEQPYVGTRALERVERELAGAQGQEQPGKILQLELACADLRLAHGRVQEAIELLESALDLARSSDRPAETVDWVRFRLAVAHLRKGAVDNDLARHNPESSLFPIRGQGVWQDPAGADAAIPLLREILDREPGDTGARWLLNLAHMSKGTYPDGVQRRFRVPPRPAEPEGLSPAQPDVPRFTDIARELGLDRSSCGGGVVFDDMDGDGFLDLVSSSFQPAEPLRYFHNDGHGAFEDWSERAHLSDQLGGINLFQVDYDGDGLLDLFVVRGAWMGEVYGRQRNSLLHQEKDFTFTDVTLDIGLKTCFPTSTAGWADFDLDGDLDLYTGNEGFPCELFRNTWGVRFGDVARDVGVQNVGTTKGVAWGDYDNDGDPDLYVSNLGEPNPLYRNELRGKLENVAPTAGVNLGPQSEAPSSDEPSAFVKRLRDPTFGAWFFDYDNDGWLDLFVAGYDTNLADGAADHVGLPAHGERNRLYRNDTRGGFRNVAAEVGLARVLTPLGANFGDLDNDGFLDVYLGTGKPQFEFLVPNVAYQNLGGKRFVDATAETGLGHLQKCQAVAFGDADNDGDQDLFARMGGFYPADAFPAAFFENPGRGNHWVTLLFHGAKMNRFALGARVRVDVEGGEGERSVHAVVGSGGCSGASSLQQEIGLGSAERILRVVVRWPGGGSEQTFESVPLDSFVLLTEGEPEASVLKRWTIELDGKGSD